MDVFGQGIANGQVRKIIDVLPTQLVSFAWRLFCRTSKDGYRKFVTGESEFPMYDLIGRSQFNLLLSSGLKRSDYLLDVGCGCLCGGKFCIRFLEPRHYYGIEPEEWLIERGIRLELGYGLFVAKKPVFDNDRHFTLTKFSKRFDFIVASSIFTHATQKQIARCFSEARRVMKPSSLFAATYLNGERNYNGNDWVYPGAVTYTSDRIMRLADEQGLRSELLDWRHPTGDTWVRFTLAPMIT